MTFDPLDEDAMRTAVHETFSRYVPSTELDGFQRRVRAGARRLRAVRWISGTVGGVAVLAGALFAFDTVGRQPDQQPTSAVVTPPPCPSSVPNGPLTSGRTQAGADKTLVPGRPVVGTYCDWASTATGVMKSTTSLRRSGALSAAQFTAVLAALHTPVINERAHCAPGLSGQYLLLLFRYASGPDVTVSMELDGCVGVTNGMLTGLFAPAGQTPPALEALGVDPKAAGSPSSQPTPGSSSPGQSSTTS